MMNELICVLMGHDWLKGTMRFPQKATIHKDTLHEWTGAIEIEYRECYRCDRAEIQGWNLVDYDD